MLSAEQEETVKTQQFTRLLQAWQAGLMTTKEFKDACNRNDLLLIQVDTSIEKIEPPVQGEKDSGDAEAPKAPKSKVNKAPEAPT
jgi:hypothetical protein